MDWNLYERIILEGEKYDCPSLEPQGTNEPFLDRNLDARRVLLQLPLYHLRFLLKHFPSKF